MKPIDDIEDLVRKFHITASAEMHKRTLRDVLAAQDKSERTTPADLQPNIWRIVMKSRITKFAAAAVIIIAVMIGINQFGGSIDGARAAWGKTVKPLMKARTVVFNVIMGQGENVPVNRVMNNSTQRVRNEMLSPDGKTIQVIQIIDYETSQVLSLYPKDKTALLTDLKDLPEKPENILETMRNIITDLQEDPAFSVELLGEQELNGQITTVVRATRPDEEFTIWADLQTHLPIRVEQKWRQMQFVCTNFEFDIDLDESLFNMEIPEGYSKPQENTLSVTNSKEQDLIVTLRIWAETILDDTFPIDFNGQVYLDDCKRNRQKFAKLTDEESLKLALKLQPGFVFVMTLKDENDWHYVGRDVKLGDGNSPICWYKPTDSETYRVIYGDLTIKDIAAENLPE
ncbi:MAG: hypothetical protein ACYTBZ_20430 [Planctomycetota bacterium]|jgi:outer membrane lipoprotein-sorting protein